MTNQNAKLKLKNVIPFLYLCSVILPFYFYILHLEGFA